MSKARSFKELRRDPKNAAQLFDAGTPVEFTDDELLRLVGSFKSIDLRKGVFGEIVQASQALKAGKEARLPLELLTQLTAGMEWDDPEYQTLALPAPVVIGGAAAAGLAVGLLLAWYTSGGGGKGGTTIVVKSTGGTVTITNSGNTATKPGKPDDEDDDSRDEGGSEPGAPQQ